MKDTNTVKIWEEKISIPTYSIGKPDKNPMFLEKRVYQGSSGVVYPYPIIEKIYDDKKEKTYIGLFIENKYLKILILPELGGRVQMAYDKIKKRHFVYYNQVIKPALVGLLGPWISGGIEFNWPQHHRPTTFKPVDYTLQENQDGSKTIWTNEVEQMFYTKALAGFTLYPDKAYLEIKIKLYNRTSLPQTFLWWANPAVKVNDHYQSVFPPDVNAVFDHGKRDVSTFPVATGVYYKVDYSPGTDISFYKNIPVPTSYMVVDSDYDFVGGYEHDSEGGILHVANHYISPGKKQWTWGNGDFGKAWERNLTDEDGPYIELMTGVYTDNQPDFSWLMPYETKSFTQYFLPYQKLGLIKNATKDILLNVELNGDKNAAIKIYATSIMNCSVKIYIEDSLAFEKKIIVSPEDIFEESVQFSQKINSDNYLVVVENQNGKELIRYEPKKNLKKTIPEPAKPPKNPEEIESIEQLFLIGQHLEQYRHATYSPVAYYKEALRREPGDIRNNNALGRWYLYRGQFKLAESHLLAAIKTQTERNPNPYDGEPYYNLGLCLKYQGRLDEAYKAFYKSIWNCANQDSAYYALAEINISRHEYHLALENINYSLKRNASNNKAKALKVAILRKLNMLDEALEFCQSTIEDDLFNLSAYFEKYLIYLQCNDENNSNSAIDEFLRISRKDVQTLITYSLDYASAGLFEEAIMMLKIITKEDSCDSYPMVYYFIGWFYCQLNDDYEALKFFSKGFEANSDYCFPNRLEEIFALEIAQKVNKNDFKAPYYLGCLYYDKKQYDLAIEQWHRSIEINNKFPTVHRNLGIAYYNKKGDIEKSLRCYEIAFSLDTSDSRILMELAQLYKRTNVAPSECLSFLEKNIKLVELRDDLFLERITLYNFLDQFKKAFNLIMSRKFHPWEGGEGKVSGQYVYSLVEMAKDDICNDLFDQAIEKLEKAQVYPINLGEGKLFGTRENDIYYWLGFVYEKLGDENTSKLWFTKATKGDYSPTAAMFYNDQPPEKIFYQGLAWLKLNNQEKAHELFHRMINYGNEHKNDEVKIDYFAISLPDFLIFDDDLTLRNKIHCDFLIALGSFGLGNFDFAIQVLKQILDLDAMHLGARSHLKLATGLLRKNIISPHTFINN